MEQQEEDMLVFQVDLFSAADARPHTIADVWAREKEIRFSSRTRQVTTSFLERRREAEAIRKVLAKLPPELKDDKDVQALAAYAAEKAVNIVHLIYRSNAWEGGSRDYEFSRRTMDEHWEAGSKAITETIRHGEVLARNIADGKTAAFDLTPR
jgi:NTE family protein